MKRILCLLISAVVLIPLISLSADEIDLEAFAMKFVAAEDQAWKEGRFEALQAVEDPNIVFHGLGLESFEAHKQYIMESRKGIESLEQNWEYITGDGQLFAMAYDSTATVEGMTSRTTALMLFRLKNGRISDVWLNASTAITDE